MDIVMLGGGGHASACLGVVEDINVQGDSLINVSGVADDQWERPDRFTGRCDNLITGVEAAAGLNTPYLATIGYAQGRSEMVARAQAVGIIPCAPIIHHRANVSAHASVGDGSIVFQFASLSALSQVGDHCYVSLCANLGHDSVLGDYSTLLPYVHVAGDCVIGERVQFGSGSRILAGLTVGDGATIGAGAVVTKDVAAGEIVAGIPAKPMGG